MEKFPDDYECDGQIDIWEWMEEKETQSMTREEKLDWLCRLRSGLVWFDVPPKERPMFEEVLSDEINDLQQEPCEDAISREYILSKAHCCCDDLADDEPCCVDVDDIKNAPSVKPKPIECEDCISRAQALSDYADWFGYGYRDNTFYKHLKDMPSIQPKPKTEWIPVSERLPKEGETVLVCYQTQGGVAQSVCEWFEMRNGGIVWSTLCGEKPIAWMPLPKPYTAESEG